MARERCQRCDAVQDVDAKGRVAWHLRASGRLRIDCDGSNKPSKEHRERTDADQTLAKHRRILDERGDMLVALDAYIECSGFDRRLGEWKKLALWQYCEKWLVRVAHPYRYETRCAPDNRRAETRGEVYCRFCGGAMFQQVKQPHDLVKGSGEAQRHLTICALHVLTGERESVAPNFKALPLEDLLTTGAALGPLFESKT
jgi:hypothetical protein